MVEAVREAARALAVGEERAPTTVGRGGTPSTTRELADLLDGVVLALGHLERAARLARPVGPTPRANSHLEHRTRTT